MPGSSGFHARKHVNMRWVVICGMPKALQKAPSSRRGAHRQLDPQIKAEVERSAIELATDHFEALGYHIDSVEADNVGWDLEAVHRQTAALYGWK